MGKELNGTTLLGAYWSTEVVSGSGSGTSENNNWAVVLCILPDCHSLMSVPPDHVITYMKCGYFREDIVNRLAIPEDFS